MIQGVVIAESLREGTSLDELRLTLRKLSRWAVTDASVDQPKVWTIIEFEGDSIDPDVLAEQLAGALDQPGWYVDFHTEDVTYVVFPGKTFRYKRGDAVGRAEVVAYALAHGVPDSQVDWTD